MPTRFLTSINRVSPAQWNALNATDTPFLRHEFFAALESTRCANADTGWKPMHLVLEDDSGELLGAAPLYLKSHSWGEFVFDWSWARAYNQAGLEYYPKLVSMTPFTPATSPRLLVAPAADAPGVRRQLATAIVAYAREHSLSSAHSLFCATEDREALSAAGFSWRKDCQFHWHNRGYVTFDDFMATFRSDKRKKALRERRKVSEGGVEYRTLSGQNMTDSLWDVVFAFSARTFEQHGHEHYLNASFFRAVSA
ncbi:MAG TPA: peptidogalycan biosysnthesis protein, partial [Povalibacter sp.]